MAGPQGVEPNITDVQWQQFQEKYLMNEQLGFKVSGLEEVYYEKLCTKLQIDDCSLAQLQLKEFSMALREGLKMEALSSEDVQLLAGKVAAKEWWNKIQVAVDIDSFHREFVQKNFELELTLFHVLLVKNIWIDIKRVLESLNTSPNCSKTMITEADFASALMRLCALGMMDKKDMENIKKKVTRDDLYEKEGAYIKQLDYMKNFLMHYIPSEIELHRVVYPHWEDSAEKFRRFAISVKPELTYRLNILYVPSWCIMQYRMLRLLRTLDTAFTDVV